MKAQDVVNKLALSLPQLSDKFTTNLSITSLTSSGTTATATTVTPHGLSINDQVNIVGADTPISISSLTRTGIVGTLVTASDHDITKGAFTSVVIEGATEAEFNGTFTIISVDNRRTIRFQMVDAGPTTATGSPLLTNGSSILQSYNGLYAVSSVPTDTTFTYELVNGGLFSPSSGTIEARTLPRISAAVNFDRLLDAYTEQPQADLWLFVVLEDTVASKNRQIASDATDNIQRSNYFRQQLTQGVSLYLFIPTSQEISGRQARDLARDLFRPIGRSILFHKFDSGLFSGDLNPLIFISHGFQAYNTAFYVHTYLFEQVADLLFQDTVGHSEDVAFRDITLNMGVDIGTGIATADLDLDDTPLP